MAFNEKWDHEFVGEQEGDIGEFGGSKRKGKYCNKIKISKRNDKALFEEMF